MLKKWDTLAVETAFETKWIKVRRETCRTHTGQVIDDYYVVEGHPVVLIVALTATNEFILVKQYKQGIREIVIEPPAGVVEKGEEILLGAQRELREETGYTSAQWEQIASLPRNPSNTDNYDYVFLVREAVQTHSQQLDELENIEILSVSLDELRRMLREGIIAEIGSVSALYLALEYLHWLA